MARRLARPSPGDSGNDHADDFGVVLRVQVDEEHGQSRRGVMGREREGMLLFTHVHARITSAASGRAANGIISVMRRLSSGERNDVEAAVRHGAHPRPRFRKKSPFGLRIALTLPGTGRRDCGAAPLTLSALALLPESAATPTLLYVGRRSSSIPISAPSRSHHRSAFSSATP